MTDFRRNVDPKLRRKTDTNLLELNNLKTEYNNCKIKTDRAESKFRIEENKLRDARERTERAEEALADVQVEIDADHLPEGAQPRPRIHKRDKLAQELSQMEAALDAQRQATNAAHDEFMECEKVMFQADRNINRFAETLEDTLLAMATIKELDRDKAERLAKMEREVAQRKEQEKLREQDAKDAQAQALAELEAQREETAKKLNKVAKAKVAQTTQKLKDVTSQIKEVHETQQADRTEAVLELKANTNAVNAKLASQANKYRKKVADAAQRLEDEKEALLSKGLNPYVEFRRKELDAEAEAREKAMRESVEKNKVDLAIRIAKEQRLQEKRDKADRKAFEYEKKHRDSQGRQVVEERNRAYIVAKTADHMEVLDPTGKLARVNPSQITDIPDFSFGLGKSARIPEEGVKRITALMRESLRVDQDDLGEYQHLTATLRRATAAQRESMEVAEGQDDSDDEGAGGGGRAQSAPAATSLGATLTVSNSEYSQLETLANQRGVMPGTDKAALTVNLKGSEVEKQSLLKIVVEEEGDKGKNVASSINSLGSPKYKLAELSKFERDALDRAKDRHKDRIELGVEQVAGGKTFHGQSFVAKPAEIIFKDFEVGRKYKKTFTMTNVSYTFNSFKLLDFDDDVIDFFLVTFEKPGRLSPGMSCTLEVGFTPQINQDIFTKFRFFTETGPVDIPLHCLIKRCAPRITTPHIDFGTVVMGQILTQPLKISNTQAIGTKFTVYPVYDELASVTSAEELLQQPGDPSVVATEVNPDESGANINIAEGGDNIGSEPAINEAELGARVQRVMTAVWRRKKRENPQPLSCNLVESFVDGYSSTALQITCAPLTVGPIEQKFSVVFDGVQDSMGSVDPQGALITREQMVTVQTVGEEVPIYVEEETMDLRCTLYDRIYRQKVVLKNRGKAAFRVIVKVARAFAPYVECNPTMFFVQAKSSQSMNVKFTPTLDVLTKLAHFTLPYENYSNAALLQLPIEIEVVNQDLPVYFILKSSVTPSTVTLSSPVMEFGKIYVGQQSTQRITVTNTSMLPQKTAFVRMKKEFSVSPNDGFAVLLPNESMEFEISFCPLSAISYELDLMLLTSFNDSYTIKVIAEGIDPPITFSAAVIQMRTTGPGERVIASTTVTNNSKNTQSFEVMLPDKKFSWLTVSPTVVALEAGKSCRLEVEYAPPEDAASLDPEAWHAKLQAGGQVTSPFEEWIADSGWVFAKGMFGEIQWVKEGAGKPADPPAAVEGSEAEGGEGSEKNKKQEDEVEFTDVPKEEWGIIGKWNLPVMLKSRRRGGNAMGATLDSTVGSPLNKSATFGGTSSSGGVPSPLYLTVQTAITLPQIDADIKLIDFGQISVGTRQLKTFKIFNKGYAPIKLKTIGLNAVGPFTLLRPIREILPGESRIAIVECLPMLPGLVVEVLEVSAEDEMLGGHRLRITIKVQGLKPSVDLEGLAPPPANWNPRSGILDFSNVLVNDVIVKKFVIRNKSTFAVDARIVRVNGFGLPPLEQSQLIERTANGIPVISIRPERIQIARGQAEEIEVTFRPDRGRFQPFREDIDVMIGDTDEILRVGILGRCWGRQLFIVTDNPKDEAFCNVLFQGTSSVEDLLVGHSNATIRTAAVEAQSALKVKCPAAPEITLEYPDPFSPQADPSSYTSMDAPPAGGKAAPPPKKDAPAAVPPGARQQTKRLMLSSTKVLDNRPGVGPGTFEVILGAEAKASGIWSVSTDKGAITPTADVPLDIMCTQPKPRSLGGIFVGSWKSFSAEIVVKGGWFAQGESDENRIPVTLKAFVSL